MLNMSCVALGTVTEQKWKPEVNGAELSAQKI